jgi:predicted metal-binding membrane protein
MPGLIEHPTIVEAAGSRPKQRARSLVLPGVVVVTLLCWAWIAPMARDMYGSMTGLSAWMMTSTWDARHLFLLWLMWAVMMAAMMLPSAIPVLLLYERAVRRQHAARHPTAQWSAMAAGYLAAWAAFSVGATILQRALSVQLVINPMMEMSTRRAIAATLLMAGAYQFTPWKAVCLRHCRSPLAFVMQRFRRGTFGAARMGIEHGLYCIGCCWALMLLLFAAGVMNLAAIIGLTAIVLIEKITPVGPGMARATGALLVAAGIWFVVT